MILDTKTGGILINSVLDDLERLLLEALPALFTHFIVVTINLLDLAEDTSEEVNLPSAV